MGLARHTRAALGLPFPFRAFGDMIRRMRELTTQQKLELMIRALEDSGLGPSGIAREAAVSRTTLHRFVTGDARMPSYETVSRVETLYRQRCLGVAK